MKRFWLFCTVAVMHLLTVMGAGGAAFAMGMSRFDSGVPVSGIEQVLTAVWKTLSFPIPTLVTQCGLMPKSAVLGYVPFVLNSLLWAGLVLSIVVMTGALRRQIVSEKQP